MALEMPLIYFVIILLLTLYFIIDNTWLTSTIFNPFMYDVDIAVTSLSKHYSGGHCISGALICKNINYYQVAKDWYTSRGYHVSTHSCSIILMG